MDVYKDLVIAEVFYKKKTRLESIIRKIYTSHDTCTSASAYIIPYKYSPELSPSQLIYVQVIYVQLIYVQLIYVQLIYVQVIAADILYFKESKELMNKSVPSDEAFDGRGKAGGHKPQHFPPPCNILSYLSSGSHEPQPYGLPCHSI